MMIAGRFAIIMMQWRKRGSSVTVLLPVTIFRDCGNAGHAATENQKLASMGGKHYHY
jgi:hypothetical protein